METCRYCRKTIRLEQLHWATADPMDGGPWYCALSPLERRHAPVLAEAVCRHCGSHITKTAPPNDTWCDDAGFAACVKAPPGGTPVLHQPMPAALRGRTGPADVDC